MSKREKVATEAISDHRILQWIMRIAPRIVKKVIEIKKEDY